MRYLRKADERGQADFGWLNSRHTFSFGRYFDENHMGLSVLRVINDDTVEPGRGFATHGHQDMEIISYVISGALSHKDSAGNEGIIPANDVQYMSAGSGITHSEYNASETDPVHFLQIWITPSLKNQVPRYEQLTLEGEKPLTLFVSPEKSDGVITIRQDVKLYRLLLNKHQGHVFTTQKRYGYLHIIRGGATIDSQSCVAGDGMGFYQHDLARVNATEDLEAIWFDLPLPFHASQS